jgi:type I restriction enzyme S subunit
MIAKGYKNTEIGVIPEDWEVVNIVDVSTMKARIGWQGLTVSEYQENGDYYLITGTDFYNGKVNWNTCHFVTKDRYEQDANIQIKQGDILITKDGTIGKIAFVDFLPLASTLNSGVFVIRPKKDDYSSLFMYYVFNSVYFDTFLNKLTAGSTIIHLYQKDFVKFNFPLPPKPEQLAIATVLSDADALISATEKLIAKKKAIKQGAMQELLKPKEGWKEKTIEEEFEILRGRDLSKSDLDEYGKFNCILYGELFTTYNEVINNIKSKTNNKGGTKSKYGDILFPSSTTTIGIDLAKCSTLLLDNVSLGGDVIILRKKHNNVNPEFISYYLNIICKHAIAEKTKGVTIYHLHGKDLIAIQISYPSLNEQTRIATILSDMDAEISLLEKRLEKQKHIKQGMMQNLLTGKTRLVESVRKEVKKPKHNTQINEAVVISFLVYKFGTEQYPLSRFRYTKYSYLLHRQSEKEAFGFDKYAAGPYNPANRYKGAEGIALKNKYITKVQNPKSKKDAFVINENIDDALNYFNEWYGTDIQQWIEQFRFYKNNYLEVLTTVDKAICELVSQKAPVNVQTIKNYIYSIPQWKKKLEKPYFSDDEIQKAIDESKRLFGNK